MNRGLYSAVTAMRSNEQAIEVVAHNLANLSTPGFKRSNASVETFAEMTGGQKYGQTLSRSIDFSQGPIDRNASPFNLAIDGDGFFVFESPAGEVLTRNGALVVTEEGELTSPDGLPIAWESRGGKIDPVKANFEVRDDGLVMQDGDEVGRLRIADYAERELLLDLDGGYFKAPLDLEEQPAAGRILQGATENANISGIAELVSMVAYQRAFEIASRSVSMISDSYARLNRPNGG